MSSLDIAAGAPRASTTRHAKTVAKRRTFITWGALAMMITGSTADLSSAPPMAVFGLACVFLYLVPGIVFLVPTSLVSAELASGWKGGVYNWVSEGISPPMGLLAIWCQFAQTTFYYPALLAYVADTLAYIIDPNLASNGVYTAAIIIVLFWGSVLVSSRGLGLVAKLASRGTVIGTLIPGAILVVMGVVYLLHGNRSVAPMNTRHLLPAWTGLASLVLIVNNFLAYAGIEMNAVHVDELKEPAREFPKATFVAMGLVLAVFILPALVISWVIPSQQISLTAGVMQAFSAFFAHFGLTFLVPLTAIALVAASLGGVEAWLAGPSKGLLKIGREQGYLPPYFQKVNAEGIQMHILMAQGVVITLIGMLYAFIPSVSSAFWIFIVMATQVYLIMYVLMFIAAHRLRRDQPDHPRGYRAPGLVVLCVLGGLASVAAFLIGFVPPSQFGHSSPLLYGSLILAGVLSLGVIPPLLLYRLRKPSWKVAASAGISSASLAGGTASAVAPHTAQAIAAGTSTPTAAGEGSRCVGSPHGHRALSWGIGLVFVALLVAGVLIYKQGRDDRLARSRANQVVALFASHHLSVPVDRRTLIDVLGSSGGPVCANPASALAKGLQDLELSNGAATVGARATLVDRRVVTGEELVISCIAPIIWPPTASPSKLRAITRSFATSDTPQPRAAGAGAGPGLAIGLARTGSGSRLTASRSDRQTSVVSQSLSVRLGRGTPPRRVLPNSQRERWRL